MSAPIAMILAAGSGTRMRSQRPKVLHELCGRPLIMWPLLAAREAGADRIVVVDSPERPLEAVLDGEAEIAVQRRPDGTGGAAAAALERLDAAELDGDTPVLVLSGDVPLVDAAALNELVQAHLSCRAAATMASAELADPSGYGRVVRDAEGHVERVVETKVLGDATDDEHRIREVNTGIFVFAAAALRDALPRLRSDNAQAELYLPEAIEVLREDGRTVAAHRIDDPRLVLGVNDRADLARVRRLAQAMIHERHMEGGVTIVDPLATTIDVDVVIGQDTVIEPFTSIRGASRIGERCLVRHSYLHDCVLEDGVTVGPFAYLRPGTVLSSEARVGTFVEVKNSHIGRASKVPHLSYIGDAEIGEETNLGAATITANYDGRAKHRTNVGDRVKTGVDTTLVAPVTVGDDAYTGAGSVITEDVPAGSLGIARERQRNVEGYSERGPRQR